MLYPRSFILSSLEPQLVTGHSQCSKPAYWFRGNVQFRYLPARVRQNRRATLVGRRSFSLERTG